MVKKHIVISTSKDLEKINERTKFVHFRKYISSKLLEEVIRRSKRIVCISLSTSSLKKWNKKLEEIVKNRGIKVVVLKRYGRPNYLEKMMLAKAYRNLENDDDSYLRIMGGINFR
ncbi:MAG: hypothetical protein J7K98_02060 [Candidatus Aenigmarchaeota archaeon]|nr:hypothetical protein [Candidatus Aenigmarchaeota archaeon]